MRLAGVLDLVADASSKTAAIRACRPDLAELYRLRRAMPYLVHLAGGVALHAACVVVRGQTWLLCGDTGAGKSTLALACDASGHPVLADDHVALTFTDDGRLQAEASFPLVDAMPDAVAVLRPDQEPGEDKQSVPLRTARPERARIDRIAFLARGPELRRTPLPAPEAATRLLRDVLFVGDPASVAEQTRRLDVAALLAEHGPAHAVAIPAAATAEDWGRVLASPIWD